MDVSREPTHAEIAFFLNTRTGSQMVQLVNSLYEPAAQLEFAKAIVAAPGPVVGPSTTPEKAKKGLNGFVGFRCYYINCPVFKQYPMSKLSSITGQMWKFDPNHSVWTLLTKAWSVIRDQVGKPEAPLDVFLSIICPLLELPSPDIYLELQGWSVTLNDEGELELHHNDIAQSSSISARCAEVSLSVEDIINHCQQSGFALGFVHDKNTTSPTFLAHSHQQTSEEGSMMKQAVHVTDNAHETRVRAKKQRRAKRQTLRNTGLAPALKEQIVDMYVPDDDEMQIEENRQHTSPPFYDQLAAMLTNNPTNNMSSTMTNNNAAVNSMTGNTTTHHVAVNNMGGSMINNYAAGSAVPTQNLAQPTAKTPENEEDEVEVEDEEAEAEDEPEPEHEQTHSEDDQMDFEGGKNDVHNTSKDMTNDNAFRNGANKNATLPRFGQNNL